jgi:hypothetical protein
MSRPDILWVRDTHRYRKGENKLRYENPQVAISDVCNALLTNSNYPVIHTCHLTCARKRSAHDEQKQQSEDIAIHDENDFWQPPLEPGKSGQVIAEYIKCIRQTSRSTRSGYPKHYYWQMDIT